MYQRKDTDITSCVCTAGLADECAGQPEQTRIKSPEEHHHDQRENEYGNCRLCRFLLGRPDDLANLDARPLDKVLVPLALGTRHAYCDAETGAAKYDQYAYRQRKLEFVEVIRIQTANDDSCRYQQFDDV